VRSRGPRPSLSVIVRFRLCVVDRLTGRGPRSGLILCRASLGAAIDKAVFPGIQGGPHMHTIFAKAVAFKEAMGEAFQAAQRRTLDNARALAAALVQRGLCLVSGGTENHLMLVDLRPLNLTGKVGANLLEEAGIVVNKNTIPYDPKPPAVCSGIRLGTPALSTRGMGGAEMEQIAEWIADVLRHPDDQSRRVATARAVRDLCARFPAPQ
jgi:glycine hydroxymethyltransferase